MSRDQAMKFLDRMLTTPAKAVYDDGRRIRLGTARLATARSTDDAWFEWRAVEIRKAGTVAAIAVGRALIAIPPRPVIAGTTFSASVPVEDVVDALG
jgi:hypothetical protein